MSESIVTNSIWTKENIISPAQWGGCKLQTIPSRNSVEFKPCTVKHYFSIFPFLHYYFPIIAVPKSTVIRVVTSQIQWFSKTKSPETLCPAQWNIYNFPIMSKSIAIRVLTSQILWFLKYKYWELKSCMHSKTVISNLPYTRRHVKSPKFNLHLKNLPHSNKIM